MTLSVLRELIGADMETVTAAPSSFTETDRTQYHGWAVDAQMILACCVACCLRFRGAFLPNVYLSVMAAVIDCFFGWVIFFAVASMAQIWARVGASSSG